MDRTNSKDKKLDVIFDVLSKCGYIDETYDGKKKTVHANTYYKNIDATLENYRSMNDIRQDLKDRLAAREAGDITSDGFYEMRYEKINKQLNRIDFALSRVPYVAHPNGELSRELLYLTYFAEEHMTIGTICQTVTHPVTGMPGITNQSYHSHLNRGKEVMRNILFSFGNNGVEFMYDVMSVMSEIYEKDNEYKK